MFIKVNIDIKEPDDGDPHSNWNGNGNECGNLLRGN